MAINSKAKGSKNERVVAKLLTKWTGHEFSKTPASGGMGWKNRDSISGDVVCTGIHQYEFPFSIEAKFYNELNFSTLILLQNSDIIDFWGQCKKDATKAKRLPIVFMRQNRMPSEMFFIMIESPLLSTIKESNLIDLKYGFIKTHKGFTIINSNDFLKTDYTKVLPLSKTYQNGRFE